MKLGGGGRFAALVGKIKARGGKAAKNPEAVAASAGRKKYGKSKFQSLAGKARSRMSESMMS